MSGPVEVKVDGVKYRVHEDGDVFRVNEGWTDTTREVGKISPSTPTNKLEEKIRELINR